MKIATPLLRKHSLSIALLAAIGLSSSAVIAQESVSQPAPPANPPDARTAAQADTEMAASQQGAPQRGQQQHRASQQQTSLPPEQAGRYITGQAVVMGEDGSQVVVRSRPNLLPQDPATGVTDDYAVSGDYSINFSDLDEDGDGFISREEAQADPNLSEQFTTADRDNDGMLSPTELDDWTR